MTQSPQSGEATRTDHVAWVRARMSLDDDFLDSVRHGFSLIAAGFGSFSLFEGLTIGERTVSPLPKTFALIITAAGVIGILVAINHDRKMRAFVDADRFGTEPALALPDERRPYYLAAGAVIIGVISFVALLMIPS